MTRREALEKVSEIVSVDRCDVHGGPENSFALIASMWSIYLGVELKSSDIACMMSLLKIARIKNNPCHTDNWIDLAGYAACGCECATEKK